MHHSLTLGRRAGGAIALAATAALVAGVTAPTNAAPESAEPAIGPRTSFTMQADGSSGTNAKGKAIPNLDIVKTTVRTYYNATNGIADKTTSPYISEIKALTDAQAAYLDAAYTSVTAAGKIPAIVLDTDDTVLWNYDMEDGAMGFDYDPALQNTWVQEQRFPAVPGMVAFANAAAAKGFAVFGVTGRSDSQRAATLANLDQGRLHRVRPGALLHQVAGHREARLRHLRRGHELHDRGVQGRHPQAHRDRPRRARRQAVRHRPQRR